MHVVRAAGTLLAPIGVVLIVLASGAWPVKGTPGDDERGIRTQRPESRPAQRTDSSELAGSADCRACHERFYELWSTSHHGLAMQPYSPEFAAANLTPQQTEIEIGRYRYQAEVGPEQGWVVERGPDGERRLKIAHALGGKNVYYFLTPSDHGRLQTLPVAYDVRRREWFDTAGSGVRHFPGRAEDEPLHWTAREYTFNTSCYSCHVSQLATNYDLKTDSYHTVWAEPGISCETCHGPAAEHARVFRAEAEGPVPADPRIISTKVFDGEQTNSMCAPCHAQMRPLTNSFLPGARYFDHYDLVALEDPDFYPDGRDLGENYTYTLWRMNPCAKSGQLDCVHCHTSSGRFRFKDDPDRACLPCHRERVEAVAEHSHHAAGSEGGRCIDCHMPMTEFARMKRSDHSLLPPTPAATLEFESPNACNLCHSDKDAAWADREVRNWHAGDYQAPVLKRARLIQAARQRDWSRLPEMLVYLASPDREEVYAAGLIRLLIGCRSREKWPAMIAALEDESPLVRAAAAEGLHGYVTEESVPALLKATRDEFRLVRVRAAAALAGLPRELLDDGQRADLAAATQEHLAAMRVRADDHSAHYNLGNYHAERGEFEQALACYQTATKLQPADIAPLVNASLVYNAQGRNGQAERSLRRALEVEPNSVPAHLNLGMLLSEMDRMDEAEAAFRAALKGDPKCATAAFNLGVIAAQRNLAEALEWCRKAAEFEPDEPKYAYTLAFYLRESGDADAAAGVLNAAIDRGLGNMQIYALLGDVCQERGDPQRAIAIYRRAAEDERLTERERHWFVVQAEALSGP